MHFPVLNLQTETWIGDKQQSRGFIHVDHTRKQNFFLQIHIKSFVVCKWHSTDTYTGSKFTVKYRHNMQSWPSEEEKMCFYIIIILFIILIFHCKLLCFDIKIHKQTYKISKRLIHLAPNIKSMCAAQCSKWELGATWQTGKWAGHYRSQQSSGCFSLTFGETSSAPDICICPLGKMD